MEKITSKLYHEITNCSGLAVEPNIRFEIEEIVEILEQMGYEVKVHTGPAKVTYRQWECPGEYTEEVRETPNWRSIVAVLPGTVLPERVDESHEHDLMAVWRRETKKRFRTLITGK